MLGDADGWAPYAAWLIADGGVLSTRGLLPTRDGGRGLELCRDAELSVIRFVSEDRLLVIPGAETGVFVYDLDGALHDSLDAATFLAETGCDIEPNEWGRSPLNDAYARADWLGPRRIIDEVVADGAGNVYVFVRYGAERPAEEPGTEVGSLPAFGPRAVATDIAATLPNTDPACPTPHCYEPATPGLVPATSAYHWRPTPRWRAGDSPRWRSIHHVALRSSPGTARLNGQGPGFRGPQSTTGAGADCSAAPAGRGAAGGSPGPRRRLRASAEREGVLGFGPRSRRRSPHRDHATVCDRVEARGHSPAGRSPGRPSADPASRRSPAGWGRSGCGGVRSPHSTAGRRGGPVRCGSPSPLSG